jgi:A/G-specific adenine glycosylase
MELGAMVCTPAGPKCGRCPLVRMCEANRLGLQTAIPPRPPPKAVTAVSEVGVVVRDGEKVLLCRRPADAGRWQNMWEVPHGERRPGEADRAAAVRVARELTGLRVNPGAEVATLTHGVTRWAITLTCLEATVVGGRFRSVFYAQGKWVEPGALGDYPVSAPQRKLLRELTRPGRQRRLF